MPPDASAARRTAYAGETSLHLPPLTVVGTPRSGRITEENLSKEERRKRNVWRKEILQAARDYGKNLSPDLLPIRSECNLYVTFYLDDSVIGEYGTGYARLDLDNLLKPLQDTLTGRIIEDDRLFIGVKVRKEPVLAAEKEKVVLSVITTKTFTITDVQEVPGKEFIPYWKSPAQVITATDAEGNPGTFIDHMPHVFLRDEHENKLQYRDVVPGYEWQKHIGRRVTGCMVIKRSHHRTEEIHRTPARNSPKDISHFLWLHKWNW